MASRSALFNSIFKQQQMNLYLNEEWISIAQSRAAEENNVTTCTPLLLVRKNYLQSKIQHLKVRLFSPVIGVRMDPAVRIKSSCCFAAAKDPNRMYWNEQAFGITSRLVENGVFAFPEMHKSSLQYLHESECMFKCTPIFMMQHHL